MIQSSILRIFARGKEEVDSTSQSHEKDRPPEHIFEDDELWAKSSQRSAMTLSSET